MEHDDSNVYGVTGGIRYTTFLGKSILCASTYCFYLMFFCVSSLNPLSIETLWKEYATNPRHNFQVPFLQKTQSRTNQQHADGFSLQLPSVANAAPLTCIERGGAGRGGLLHQALVPLDASGTSWPAIASSNDHVPSVLLLAWYVGTHTAVRPGSKKYPLSETSVISKTFLVGGITTPLKNMSSSDWIIIPNLVGENIKFRFAGMSFPNIGALIIIPTIGGSKPPTSFSSLLPWTMTVEYIEARSVHAMRWPYLQPSHPVIKRCIGKSLINFGSKWDNHHGRFLLLWLITRDLSWKPSVSVAIWLIFILHLGFRTNCGWEMPNKKAWSCQLKKNMFAVASDPESCLSHGDRESLLFVDYLTSC